MTIEEIEGMLDELMTATDENIRAVKLTDIKLALRDYKAERDETETIKDGELKNRDDEIDRLKKDTDELRTANSELASRYSTVLVDKKKEENEAEEEKYEIDDLIKRFD